MELLPPTRCISFLWSVQCYKSSSCRGLAAPLCCRLWWSPIEKGPERLVQCPKPFQAKSHFERRSRENEHTNSRESIDFSWCPSCLWGWASKDFERCFLDLSDCDVIHVHTATGIAMLPWTAENLILHHKNFKSILPRDCQHIVAWFQRPHRLGAVHGNSCPRTFEFAPDSVPASSSFKTSSLMKRMGWSLKVLNDVSGCRFSRNLIWPLQQEDYT